MFTLFGNDITDLVRWTC